MAFFDDFANAVATYPAAKVTLSLINLEVISGTAGEVNVNEVWGFKVHVVNTGHLNMTNVFLHIQGLNGAAVSAAAAGPFSASISPAALVAVNAHSTQDSPRFYFRAPNTPKPAGTSLVQAHIGDFTANLNDLLLNHSTHSDPPSGVCARQVFP